MVNSGVSMEIWKQPREEFCHGFGKETRRAADFHGRRDEI
jgi:hypothetical protein